MWNPHLKSEIWGTGFVVGAELIAGVLVELYAVVDVVDGAVFHGGVGVDGLGALAVELEPGEAAVDVLRGGRPLDWGRGG